MSSWKDKFNELSTNQSTALERVKETTSKDEWVNATNHVKETMETISEFLSQYKEAGSPNHDEEMPSS